jgi:hypothetical protein
VINDHQLDLAAAIPYLETSVRGYSSVGYSQGVPNRWANIFVQSLGPIGIDAIVGPCGLADQAFDEILGEDPRSCEERADTSEEPQGSGAGEQPAGGGSPETGDYGGAPALPGGDAGTGESMPEDVGDLFGAATGTDLGSGLP